MPVGIKKIPIGEKTNGTVENYRGWGLADRGLPSMGSVAAPPGYSGLSRRIDSIAARTSFKNIGGSAFSGASRSSSSFV